MIQSKNSVVRVALNQSIFEKGMSDLKSLKILPKVDENDRNRSQKKAYFNKMHFRFTFGLPIIFYYQVYG